MGYLTFGADGNLYLQQYEDAPLISVKNIFRFTHKIFPGKDLATDFIFWSKHLCDYVLFEEGLTIQKFFKCLKPWEKFFSLQTRVDISDYLEEMEKPINVNSNCYNCIDYAMLYRNISFHPNRQEDYTRRSISSSRKVTPDVPMDYEFDTSYFLSGFKMGEEYPLDLSYLPMNYIADVPLVLQYKSTMQFGDWLKKENSVIENTLTMDENMYGLRKTIDNVPFIESSPEDITLEEMLRSFFRYIFSSINKRENGATIKIEMEKSEIGAEIISFPKNKKTQLTSEESKSTQRDNVIQVPFKKISRDKDFLKQIESSLIQKLIGSREEESMLIEYENRHNPNHRTETHNIFIGIPPEYRKSNIGITDKE